MIYQHPLAYLIGLEGLALLRGWGGDFDRAFVEARLDEVRRLINDPTLVNHPGVEVTRSDSQTGYANWAATYDKPNTLFAVDEPIVDEIIDALSVGDALDAACGTGRFAAKLAARGHRVIGVDSSPEMLDMAHAKLPTAEFHLGELDDLPLPDASVDLIVCALALAHVRDLAPVMAQFARVLRPGGHLVISDVHHELVFRGSVTRSVGPDGQPGRAPAYLHTPGDFLRAALPVGLQVRRCEEPARGAKEPDLNDVPPPPQEIAIGPWDEWPWALLELTPAATEAAWAIPALIVWDFQRL